MSTTIPLCLCFDGWGSLRSVQCPTCLRAIAGIGDNVRALRRTGKPRPDASYLRTLIYYLIQREPGGPERVKQARGKGLDVAAWLEAAPSIDESDLAAIGGAS